MLSLDVLLLPLLLPLLFAGEVQVPVRQRPCPARHGSHLLLLQQQACLPCVQQHLAVLQVWLLLLLLHLLM
jgi:hypothetical protein